MGSVSGRFPSARKSPWISVPGLFCVRSNGKRRAGRGVSEEEIRSAFRKRGKRLGETVEFCEPLLLPEGLLFVAHPGGVDAVFDHAAKRGEVKAEPVEHQQPAFRGVDVVHRRVVAVGEDAQTRFDHLADRLADRPFFVREGAKVVGVGRDDREDEVAAAGFLHQGGIVRDRVAVVDAIVDKKKRGVK